MRGVKYGYEHAEVPVGLIFPVFSEAFAERDKDQGSLSALLALHFRRQDEATQWESSSSKKKWFS